MGGLELCTVIELWGKRYQWFCESNAILCSRVVASAAQPSTEWPEPTHWSWGIRSLRGWELAASDSMPWVWHFSTAIKSLREPGSWPLLIQCPGSNYYLFLHIATNPLKVPQGGGWPLLIQCPGSNYFPFLHIATDPLKVPQGAQGLATSDLMSWVWQFSISIKSPQGVGCVQLNAWEQQSLQCMTSFNI